MSDVVTVQTKVDFRCWETPKFAAIVVGEQEGGRIAIADLDAAVLDQLVETWMGHLYASVGKQSPFRRPPETRAA